MGLALALNNWVGFTMPHVGHVQESAPTTAPISLFDEMALIRWGNHPFGPPTEGLNVACSHYDLLITEAGVC